MIRRLLVAVTLVATFLPPGVQPHCDVVAAVTDATAFTYHSPQSPPSTATAFFTATPVSATNTTITKTLTLRNPWLWVSPRYAPFTLRGDHPYTVYACQGGIRPGVAYLPLL